MGIQLEALQGRNKNFFVFFHETYGAYFTHDLSDFDTTVKNGPYRVMAVDEWNWAKDTWKNPKGEEPETIILNNEQSEKLISLVKNNVANGVVTIEELVREEYLETP